MKELRKNSAARKIVGLIWLLSHHLFLIAPTVAQTKHTSRNNLNNGEPFREYHAEQRKDWVKTITKVIERHNKRLSFLEHANNNQTDEEIRSLAPTDPVNKDQEINELKHEIAQLQDMTKMFRSESIGSSGGSQHHLMSKRQAASNAIICNGATVTLSSSGSCISKSFLTPDKPDTVPPEPKYIGTPFTSTITCFVAQKSSYFSNKPKSVIQFEETVLNLGKSFHSDESVFIAPNAGIYEFTFNGHKTGHTSSVLKVSLRLNGKDVLNGWSDEMGNHNGYGVHKNRNMISMHSLLKLNKGDRIDLFLKEGTLHDDDDHHQIYFTGKLLFDEDAAVATLNSTQKKIPSPVYFTLQKSAGFSTQGAVIPFEVESLNVGGAFDMKKQVFTTPVAGIYEFTLKGYKTGQHDSLRISLCLNGKAVANSLTDFVGIGHDFHTPYAINSLLKARKGDSISLYLLSGNLFDDSNHYTTYTGKLLMEQPDTQTEFLAVYFNVQKSLPFNIADEVVPFEKEILNVGGAFNMKENTFTAPKGGIYEFNFKGMKNGVLTYLVVALRLNGKPVSYAWAEYVNKHDHYTPFFLHSILKLKKGDRIDLYMEEGELLDDLNQYNHFTGKLLFADDVKV